MNKEIKAKWIEALRSDRYIQGRNVLKRYDKFCCLGVLCDILDPTEWVKPPYSDACYYKGKESWLAKEVLNTCNLETEGDSCFVRGLTDKDNNRMLYLTILNDEGFTFSQIADIIEYFF